MNAKNKQRITGFDLARALAIFGMVIVNFKIAMNAQTGNALLLNFAELFEGRASALFVILAGVGVTFLTNKARNSTDVALKNSRYSLIKRGLLLIVIGLIYTPIWPADILHFYGFYFLIAAVLFNANDKILLRSSFIIMLAFPCLMLFFDYEKNWHWLTLTYENFWTFDGMLRHIVFNGFHPIFPWAAFLVFGMWLARQDLSNKLFRAKLLKYALFILIITESLFYYIRVMLGDGSALALKSEEVAFIFSTAIIPPLPQYVISATSSAVIILIGCLIFSEKFSNTKLHEWLAKTGQMSLTLYVAHVFLGMGVLESFGWLTEQTIELALFSAFLFCLWAIVFSVFWLNYFKTGPLEWMFRKLSA